MRRATLVAVCLLSVVLVGCAGANGDAEPSSGQVERTETITASNLVLVADKRGRATLVGALVNKGEVADSLVEVELEAEDQNRPVAVELVRGPVHLPVRETVRLATEPYVLAFLPKVRPGSRVRLQLTFDKSAPISTTVAVEPNTGMYADVVVPPR